MKRMFSAMLSLVLILSLLPARAWAAEDEGAAFDIEHGSVCVSCAKAAEGPNITVTASPDPGAAFTIFCAAAHAAALSEPAADGGAG